MLSRKRSNASGRLRRARSTSSVNSNRRSPTRKETVDPVLARQQALTAASLAYGRSSAKEMAASDESNGPGLRRRGSTVSTQGAYDRGVQRRQSVRFAGPTAKSQPRSSAVEEDGRKYRLSTTSSILSGSALSGGHDKPDVLTGPETVAFVTPGEIDSRILPESGIASNPSSYRRLHRAKSMFNTKPVSSDTFTDDRSGRGEGLGRSRANNSRGVRQNILKKPKSLSFLRESFASKSILDRQKQDVAVQMARESYLQQMASGTRHGSASAAPSTDRRQSKSLRKSLRTSSIGSFGEPVASPNQTLGPRKRSLATKARDFSASLKDKLKRAFHRSDDRLETSPIQHVEARRSHSGQKYSPDLDLYHEEDVSSVGQEGSFSMVNARLPSVRPCGSSEEVHSLAGSIRSGHSENVLLNDRSRVTSWTDSTPIATLAPRRKLNRRSMSIIEEDAPTFDQLTSADPQRQAASYSAFQGPMHELDRSPTQSEPVDSQRVYSALRRRIGNVGSSSSADYGAAPANSAESRPSHGGSSPAPSDHSSRTAKQQSKASNSQAKNVRLVADSHSNTYKPWAPKNFPDSHPTATASNALRFPSDWENQYVWRQSEAMARLHSSKTGSKADVRSQSPHAQDGLYQTSEYATEPSASNDGPAYFSYDVSDYQNAIGTMPGSTENLQPRPDKKLQGFKWQQATGLPTVAKIGSTSDIGSFYSRTTGGQSPLMIEKVLAPPRTRISQVPNARILRDGSDPQDSRATSDMFSSSIGSSVEWQTIMSSQVPGPEHDAGASGWPLGPNQGHVFERRREYAHVDDANVSSGSETDIADQSDAEVDPNAETPGLKHKRSLKSLFPHTANRADTEVLTQTLPFEPEPQSTAQALSVRQQNDPEFMGSRSALRINTNQTLAASAVMADPSGPASRSNLAPESPSSMKSSMWPAQTRGSPDRARKLAANRPGTQPGNARGVYKNYNYRNEAKENLTPSPKFLQEKHNQRQVDKNGSPLPPSPDRRLADVFLSKRRRNTSGDSGVDAFI